MSDNPPAPALTARVPLKPRRLLSLRFAARFEHPALLGLAAGDERTLWPVELQSGAATTLPPLQLDSPFGQPEWDAIRSSAGLAAVWSRPGSAISPLWTSAGGEAPVLFSRQQPQKVFWNPRFVRGDGAVGLTAATLDGPVARLVLLQRRDAPQQALPPVGRGRLRSGLLLRRESGYWLLTLSAPPDAHATQRRDLGGAWLMAGRVWAVPLDESYAAVAPPQAPFGELPVYEFDADTAADTVGVLATTEHGHVAARGRSEGGAWRWQTSPPALAGAALFSPAVIAHDGSFALAALPVGDAAPQPVWTGRL